MQLNKKQGVLDEMDVYKGDIYALYGDALDVHYHALKTIDPSDKPRKSLTIRSAAVRNWSEKDHQRRTTFWPGSKMSPRKKRFPNGPILVPMGSQWILVKFGHWWAQKGSKMPQNGPKWVPKWSQWVPNGF